MRAAKKKKKTWKRFKIWDQWKAISRAFRCIAIAMSTESQTCKRRIRASETLSHQSGKSTFSVERAEYIETLNDSSTFCGMVLQATFGLIEEHARDILRELNAINFDVSSVSSVLDSKQEPFDELVEYFPPPNGIEAWGAKLLRLLDRQWTDVTPQLSGVVEVAVVRTALAHGSPIVTERMANRMKNLNGQLPWKVGDSIVLDFERVTDYRDRLRSFARVLADAAAAKLNDSMPTMVAPKTQS